VSAGTWQLALSASLLAASLGFLLHAWVRSVREHRTAGTPLHRDFGLTMALAALFLAAWAGQALAEYRAYAQEQATHGEAAQPADYLAEFLRSTLSNHQSEYLQLLAFVTLSGLWLHRGSAESRDSDERMEAKLDRVLELLDRRPFL